MRGAIVAAAAAALLAACDRGVSPAQQKPGEFVISTLSAPPGRSVSRTFGFYCRWFQHAPGADYGAAFTAANVALKAEGEKLGANAFINFRVASVLPGDAKSATGALVTLCGDFVELK